MVMMSTVAWCPGKTALHPISGHRRPQVSACSDPGAGNIGQPRMANIEGLNRIAPKDGST